MPEPLEIIDANDDTLEPSTRAAVMADLVAVHHRYFPAYPHVMDEVVNDLRLPQTIHHAWLLRMGGRGVGEFLFHISLRRRVVQIHYVAMDTKARAQLPRGWLADVTDAALATGVAEAAARHVDLLAMAGEMYSTPADFRRWRHKGFLILALDYREPIGGRSWPERGDITYQPLTLGVRLTEHGRATDPLEVLDEVLDSFLLDYYELPATEPEVMRMYRDARRLGLRELSDNVINSRPTALDA